MTPSGVGRNLPFLSTVTTEGATTMTSQALRSAARILRAAGDAEVARLEDDWARQDAMLTAIDPVEARILAHQLDSEAEWQAEERLRERRAERAVRDRLARRNGKVALPW